MTANMHTFKHDKKMTSCEGCSKKFTTFLRRHHCRGCRGAYCHYCSKKKIEVPDWPGKQRVCDECFDQYSVRCKPPVPKSTRQLSSAVCGARRTPSATRRRSWTTSENNLQ